ncbi:anti-sigma factor family protein [Paraburkholderia phosphatilytica]|uniref:anti-sigma factor family protein n=1 Tax=Paraburkholderia phosphatilytica TaxID=2282883 RepID=UPI000E471595|nr:anti-sigma factor [Paraburkholderia phosphatilytica]
MTPDDSKLIAYVDGELDAADSAGVEQALAASPDLRESVDLLRASRLPYREAFAAQKLPPLPDALQRQIEAMASAAQPADSDAPTQHPAHREAPRRYAAPLRLAAAFVAGAIVSGSVLHFVPGASPFTGNLANNLAGNELASNEATPWIRAAVDYQRLYTRDTVADVEPNLAASAKTADAIREVDHLPLRVPDLHDAGLDFKAIARLRFNDRPLVQIVYLPQRGAPVALCVMKDIRPDQQVAQQQLNGMTVVSWRQNELAYALIATPGTADLQAVARRIESSSVDALFASLAAQNRSSS